MRRPTDLFTRLCQLDHLIAAARLTMRGKRRRPSIARFLSRREATLVDIAAALREARWRPEGFRLLRIHDPKPRVIAAAPVADRVVHTAMVELMTPCFARSLMPEDHACRPGHGVHRAVLAIRRYMRCHRFAVHLDIRAFFPSVEPGILRSLVAARVPDERFLAVLDAVLESGLWIYRDAEVRRFARLTDDWPPPGRGLPIGAATSQFLATHVYLMALDHHIKRDLKVPGLVRFVDDIILFGDRRAELRAWRAAIGEWLWRERGLLLKHPEARVLSCAGHIDALGHRITRDGQQALPAALRRMKRRVSEAVVMGAAPGAPDLRRSLAATAGVVLF